VCIQLPRILRALVSAPTAPILLSPLTSFTSGLFLYLNTTGIIAYTRLMIAESDKQYSAELLYDVQHAPYSTQVDTLATSDLWYLRRLLSLYNTTKHIVILSRSSSRGRTIDNQLEVMSTIRQFVDYPIKVCDVHGMEFIDILSCLSSAVVVIGIHGSDLSQVVWSHSALIEIGYTKGSKPINDRYRQLATRLNNQYYLIKGEGHRNSNVKVDITQLQWALVSEHELI
jgi:hypothetical protein